jgi:hypothetical protein
MQGKIHAPDRLDYQGLLSYTQTRARKAQFRFGSASIKLSMVGCSVAPAGGALGGRPEVLA